MKGKNSNWLLNSNRILLGLLMLIPGISKLFLIGPSGVTGMLSGIGFPLAAFFAWVLIILEIGSGTAIILNWKIKYSITPAAVILLVAILTVHLGNTTSILLHLVAISNYFLIAHNK